VVPQSAALTALMAMDCWLPLPTVTLRVPVLLSCSLELATADRSAVEAVLLEPVPLPAVIVALSVLLAAAASKLLVTTMLPSRPKCWKQGSGASRSHR